MYFFDHSRFTAQYILMSECYHRWIQQQSAQKANPVNPRHFRSHFLMMNRLSINYTCTSIR